MLHGRFDRGMDLSPQASLHVLIRSTSEQFPTSIDSPDGRNVVLLYRLHILSALMSGGRTVVAAKIDESGEEVFGGVAVWFPPNEALNIWNIRRMAKAGVFKLLKGWGIVAFFRAISLLENSEIGMKRAFEDRSKLVGKVLKPKDSWHLQAIMTSKAFEGRGLMSLLQREGFAHAIKVAKSAGQEVKPITLEASSDRARDRYFHLGYEFAPNQPFILGKGKVDDNGLKTSSSEKATGIRIYCMINWNPDPEHGRKESKN
ncbi:hypothetical protein VNI00_009670 [Paramarasmius palmivorus]|uniref:N-acetyltransferase domain-containing protein n=1 Tax=Paramarasmius palmivorus TaxID=297713 RepID=A0AAW0CQ60_9AGAR